MQPDSKDRLLIRQYLLGELAGEGEREQIEERLLTNDEFFDEFELVKEELIDQYVEGEITGETRERFERHFLTTPGRQRSLRLAQVLTAYPTPPPEKQIAK